ncbi:hypothetical protein GQ53DRAFT_875472 [Thozetella sp. PMI_491]|nr:hypothetical protein GQ53DRAFT_875472 [Thozetella sp. PMI_491]
MTTGSCLCGAVNFEYNVAPVVTALCHCRDCQKWGGGGGSSNAAVPTAEFHVTKGTPKKFTRLAAAGKPHHHFFCGDCGSSLYSQPEGMEGVTLVKGGSLDGGASNFPVQVEFFVKDRRVFDLAVDGAQQLQTMV